MIKMDFPNLCNVRGCLICYMKWRFCELQFSITTSHYTLISYLIQVSYYIVFFFHCSAKVLCFVSQNLDVDKISSKCRFTFTKSLQFWPSQTTNKMLMYQVRHFSLNEFPFNFVTLKFFRLFFNWNQPNSPNFLVQKFSIVHSSSFLLLTSPILSPWTKYSLSFPGNEIIHNSDLSAYVLSVLFSCSSSVHSTFCEGCLLSTNRLISHTVRTDLSDSLNEAVAKSASD